MAAAARTPPRADGVRYDGANRNARRSARPSPVATELPRSAVTLRRRAAARRVVVGCAAEAVEAPLPPVAEPLSPSLVDTGQYRLEPGDVLRVKFIYQPEMDVKVQIDPDGNIAIPGVGEVQARGKTAEELATRRRDAVEHQPARSRR